MTHTGIITKTSVLSFNNTYQKLKTIIENNPNLKILLELDHTANAAKVDLTLPPTKIIMFGNPKLGTPLMNVSNSVALDLPQKILVTEREGIVYVSYNDPIYLKDRHQIEESDNVLDKIIMALDTITTKATQE